MSASSSTRCRAAVSDRSGDLSRSAHARTIGHWRSAAAAVSAMRLADRAAAIRRSCRSRCCPVCSCVRCRQCCQFGAAARGPGARRPSRSAPASAPRTTGARAARRCRSTIERLAGDVDRRRARSRARACASASIAPASVAHRKNPPVGFGHVTSAELARERLLPSRRACAGSARAASAAAARARRAGTPRSTMR